MKQKSLALFSVVLSAAFVGMVVPAVKGTAAPAYAEPGPSASYPPTPTPAATTPATTPPAATSSPTPTTTGTRPPGDLPPLPRYDIEAVGATVSVRAGSVVRIAVGLRNHGPDVAVGHAGVTGGFQSFSVVLPPGTQVVGDAHGCENADLYLGFGPQGCSLSGLVAGESLILLLDIRIVGPITGYGTVTRNFTPALVFHGQDPDTNHANDTARIVVRELPAAPILPATGSSAGPLAAAGAAIVIVGAVLVLVARRRRTDGQPSIVD